MEREYLEWINNAYRILVDNKEVPKMQKITKGGGKIMIYRVGDVIRCDIKRPETVR